MFQVEKVNCICVDWKRGSRTEYTQASYNTRVVGAEIAFLVQVLSVMVQPRAVREGGGVRKRGRVREGWVRGRSYGGVKLDWGRVGGAELERWS